MTDMIPVIGLPDTYNSRSFQNEPAYETCLTLSRDEASGRNAATFNLPIKAKFDRSGRRIVSWHLDSAVKDRKLLHVPRDAENFVIGDDSGKYRGIGRKLVTGTVSGEPVIEILVEEVKGDYYGDLNELNTLPYMLGLKSFNFRQNETRIIRSVGYLPIQQVDELIGAVVKDEKWSWKGVSSSAELFLGEKTKGDANTNYYTRMQAGIFIPSDPQRVLTISSSATNYGFLFYNNLLGCTGATSLDDCVGNFAEALTEPNSGNHPEFYVQKPYRGKIGKTSSELVDEEMSGKVISADSPEASLQFCLFRRAAAKGEFQPTISGYQDFITRFKD
jgi:hypothetical protein